MNVLRKYSSVLDLPMSFLLAPNVYTAGLRDWMRLNRAMALHRSQYVWFRKLYMAFSRYNFINTFDQMKLFPSATSSLPGAGSQPSTPLTPLSSFNGDTRRADTHFINKKKYM